MTRRWRRVVLRGVIDLRSADVRTAVLRPRLRPGRAQLTSGRLTGRRAGRGRRTSGPVMARGEYCNAVRSCASSAAAPIVPGRARCSVGRSCPRIPDHVSHRRRLGQDALAVASMIARPAAGCCACSGDRGRTTTAGTTLADAQYGIWGVKVSRRSPMLRGARHRRGRVGGRRDDHPLGADPSSVVRRTVVGCGRPGPLPALSFFHGVSRRRGTTTRRTATSRRRQRGRRPAPARPSGSTGAARDSAPVVLAADGPGASFIARPHGYGLDTAELRAP